MQKTYSNWLPWVILFFSELFYIVQSSLQLSTGILFEPIMNDFAVSAFYASILNSVYYYMYFAFQIPAGLVMDSIGPRRLLFFGALICSAGCLIFSLTHSYSWALLARFCTGGAAAVAFVGVLYIIREWFSPQKKAALVAITEILTMLGSIRGLFILSFLLTHFNWQVCIQLYSLYFFIIAVGSGIFIRDKNPERLVSNSQSKVTVSFSKSLKSVFTDKVAWLNGLYIGLMYTVVTVFIALWATPFLKLHLSLTSAEASKMSMLTFIGVFIGCPLFGWLSQKYQIRRALLILSGLSSTLLLVFIIHRPNVSILSEGIALLLLGILSSGYVLSFLISDDISPEGSKNTYMGFTNACCVITAPILQPLIGALLDIQEDGGHSITHLHYQNALGIMVLALVLATIVAWFIPETIAKEENAKAYS